MCECKHGLLLSECSDCGATSPTTLTDDGCRSPSDPNGVRPVVCSSHEIADYTGLGVSLDIVRSVFRFTRDHSLRLELIGTALLLGAGLYHDSTTWNDVKREYLGRLRDRIGFGGIKLTCIRKSSALIDDDYDLLRVVVAIADDERAKEDQAIVAEVVSLLGLLGEALLQTGDTVENCAALCGMSRATAYRRLDAVRLTFLRKF